MVTDIVFLVILANALDEPICLVLFDSVDIIFLSNREDDRKRLFSLPLLCICFFLLNSRRESVPFNKSDPTVIVLLLEFKLLRIGGSMPHMVSMLNACVVMGVPCNFSAEYTGRIVSSWCCLNFCSSSLTCNLHRKGLGFHQVSETLFTSNVEDRKEPFVDALMIFHFLFPISVCIQVH